MGMGGNSGLTGEPPPLSGYVLSPFFYVQLEEHQLLEL